MKNQSTIPLTGETQTRSQQSLENCLRKTALLFSRNLTKDEIEVWKQFLETHSWQAIEYAFENWQRNGRFFPKPKDILELVAAYKLSNTIEFEPCKNCIEGYVRVYEGKTVGGHEINPKTGAMKRCDCFENWKNRSAA